jgi:hypothetical protein
MELKPMKIFFAILQLKLEAIYKPKAIHKAEARLRRLEKFGRFENFEGFDSVTSVARVLTLFVVVAAARLDADLVEHGLSAERFGDDARFVLRERVFGVCACDLE